MGLIMSDKSWQGPLFIVGASRSGTSMLWSILNRSLESGLAGETHFFDDLRPRYLGKTLRGMTDEEQATCVDYFRRLSIRPYGVRVDPDESPLSRQMLLSQAEATGDTVDTIFEVFCRWRLKALGGHIWGEKTPRHVFRIDDILAAYPQARIICTVRDPRAVVASYRDWKEYQGGLKKADNNEEYLKAIAEDYERKKASYNIVIATMMWRAAARAEVFATKKHSANKVRILKYEDLVAAPAETLRGMTNWLGMAYSDDLLDIPLLNSTASRFQEKAGVSDAPNKRWREVLSDNEIAVIQSVCGSSLKDAGYDRLPTILSPLGLAAAYASVPMAVLRAARANQRRYKSLPEYIWRRLKAAIK